MLFFVVIGKKFMIRDTSRGEGKKIKKIKE